jgi:hypothetical protein
MHHHVEVWLPSNEDVETQVTRIMELFHRRNPQQKGLWDRYQIGGRWTGEHDGYDPTMDKKNIKTCRMCHGTGFRNDHIGKAKRKQDPSYQWMWVFNLRH